MLYILILPRTDYVKQWFIMDIYGFFLDNHVPIA